MALSRLERVQVWLLKAVTGVLVIVFRFFSPRRPALSGKKLPPVRNPLLLMSATQLAKKIRRKEVSSVEVVQAYIDRIQEVNPFVNAVVKDRFAAALQEAAQVDKLIEEETGGEEVLEDRLPLLGVPLSVKESYALQGMPFTTGLVSRRGIVATVDAPPVIEVFVYDSVLLTEKNTFPLGVVSCENQYPPSSGRQEEYLSSGPMCRYAEDLLPMLKIMAGPRVNMLSLNTKVDLKKLRFFTIPHDGGSPLTTPVSKELVDIQRKVAERLEADLGVKVQEVHFPELRYSFEIWDAYMALPDKEGKPPQMFAELMGEPGRPAWPLWELLKWMIGRSDHTLAAISVGLIEMTHMSKTPSSIIQMKEKLQKEVDELLGADGVFLYPSHPKVAPKHHHPLLRPFDFSYTGIINILGLPVTQCPLGVGEEGLPLGVQVVAGKLQDHLTLAVALHLEKTFGGWKDPGAN
ncbi:fatty-acid amide hydrolase 2-B [Neolamprologus brichardi]|uniref:fatty-acid amide hydrolase 2-B n=1 Tax=Neolamprologus brichardi TaxID=32507 RepID=UPI001643CFB8|nr:fatty-acid amide hydrolase 2-B [Neolamprologus brichardi]